MNKQVMLFVSLVALLILVGCTQQPAQPSNQANGKLTIAIIVNPGSQEGISSKTIQVGNGTTALEAFQQAATLQYVSSNLGAYVTSVNGLSEDNAKGRYWQYYFNNKLAPVAVDRFYLRTSGTLEFRYEAPNMEYDETIGQ